MVALLEPVELGEVAVGAAPVYSDAPPVIGPGAADAEAPMPTRPPSACYRVNEDVRNAHRMRGNDIHQIFL